MACAHRWRGNRSGLSYKTPKNGKGRTIAMSGHLVEELRAHRLRQAEEVLKVGVRLSDDTFVVAQADGSPLQPDTLNSGLGPEACRYIATPYTVPRSATRPCHSSARQWLLPQGSKRTSRAFQDRDPVGALQPCPAGDAGRCNRAR